MTLTVDHTPQVYARTKDNSLELKEDGIGLHAKASVSDAKLIILAKDNKIKGWSFGMLIHKDELKKQESELPLRTVTDIDLDHVTLVVDKTPAYNATSLEIRADKSIVEYMYSKSDVKLDVVKVALSDYIKRINKIISGRIDIIEMMNDKHCKKTGRFAKKALLN